MTKPKRPDHPPRVGMWSTISAAVQAGWPQTMRLLVILVVAGLTLSAIAIASGGEGALLSTIRGFLPLGP